MDSEETSNEKNDGDSLADDSDVPKPFWVRPFGLQNGLSIILLIFAFF
jgi:hypothetical protein